MNDNKKTIKECLYSYLNSRSEYDRNELIYSFDKKIKTIAKKMAEIYKIQDEEDLVQCGYEGVIRCVNLLDNKELNDKIYIYFLSMCNMYIQSNIEKGISEIQGFDLLNIDITKLEEAKKEIERQHDIELRDYPQLAKEVVQLLINNKTINQSDEEKVENYIKMKYCSVPLVNEYYDDTDYEELILSEVEFSGVREMIKGMKELDQKVFELIFSQNLTKAEAARALGVSDSNVRDSFERIIKFLKHPKNYYKLLHEGDKNYNFIMEFYKNNEEESIKR